MNFKDKTGQKIEMFIVKSLAYTKNKKSYWNCICDCGKEKIVRLDTGTKSCGCYKAERTRFNRKSKNLLSEEEIYLVSAKLVFKSAYLDGDLTFEEFLKLSQLPCFYCGLEFIKSNKYHIGIRKDGVKRTRIKKDVKGNEYSSDISYAQYENSWFYYNGLDRIDQSLPHNKNNIVTCCKPCNFMKRDLNQEEFLNKIEKIFSHRIKHEK